MQPLISVQVELVRCVHLFNSCHVQAVCHTMDVCAVFTCSSQCVYVNDFKWQSTTPQHPDWALLYTLHSIPIGHYYIHYTASQLSTTIYTLHNIPIGHKVSTHPNTLLGARAVSLSHLLTLGFLRNDNSYGGHIHDYPCTQPPAGRNFNSTTHSSSFNRMHPAVSPACMARTSNSKSGWQEWELGRAFKLLIRKPEDVLCPNSFTV